MSTQCVKVSELRKKKYANLEEWMKDENNLYVGRRGRIFIHEDDEKRIFHYKGSKWQNPFKVGEYSLEESLKLYEKHLVESGLIKDVKELKGKTLGCFCSQKGDCHAKILAKLVNE